MTLGVTTVDASVDICDDVGTVVSAVDAEAAWVVAVDCTADADAEDDGTAVVANDDADA